MNRRIIFTKEGINLLEKILIDEFIRNPEKVEEATKALGLELIPMIQRHLKRYTEIEEDILRIRAGMEPQYNPVEYYNGKKQKIYSINQTLLII